MLKAVSKTETGTLDERLVQGRRKERGESGQEGTMFHFFIWISKVNSRQSRPCQSSLRILFRFLIRPRASGDNRDFMGAQADSKSQGSRESPR